MSLRAWASASPSISWLRTNMSKTDHRSFLLGVIASVPVAIGGSWAFATAAANHILQPHIQSASVRVNIMCKVAEIQNQNLKAICDEVGAACNTENMIDLVAACRETNQ